MDCRAYRVCNLFAYRSTHPQGMFAAEDPAGPDNDRLIVGSANRADKHRADQAASNLSTLMSSMWLRACQRS